MQSTDCADEAALLQHYRERVEAFDQDRAEFSKIVQDLSVSVLVPPLMPPHVSLRALLVVRHHSPCSRVGMLYTSSSDLRGSVVMHFCCVLWRKPPFMRTCR